MLRVTLDQLFDSEEGTFGELTVKGYSFYCVESGPATLAGTYVLQRAMRHGHPIYEAAESIVVCPEGDAVGGVALGLNLGFLAVERDEEPGRRVRKKVVLKAKQAFNKFMQLTGGAPKAELVVRCLL